MGNWFYQYMYEEQELDKYINDGWQRGQGKTKPKSTSALKAS